MVAVRAFDVVSPVTGDSLNAALDALVSDASTAPASVRLTFAQRAQRLFAAMEATALADLEKAGESDRSLQRKAAAGGTRSRSESKRQTKRGKLVNQNPDIANDVAKGEMGNEHVDALADAAEKSGGDAANDPELIDELKSTRPDDAHKVTRRWLEKRDDTTQTRYDRQRERRSVTSGPHLPTGCAGINGRGDDESVNEIVAAVEKRADEMYLADGGRDVPDHKHPRTHQQRMFDALYELTCGPNANLADLAGLNTDLAGLDDADNSTSSPTTPAAPSAARAPNPRSMIHNFITVDHDAETQIRAACPNSSGYLPESVLERYACGAMIGGTVFNQRGEILWFGRKRRYATPAQFAALVARDKGCVQCGAHPSRCQAHHLDPFNAPVQGETNVEDMALMCTSCHIWLHDNKLTLYRQQQAPPDDDPDPPSQVVIELPGGHKHQRRKPSADTRPHKQTRQTWRTRAATPEEIAPKNPNKRTRTT